MSPSQISELSTRTAVVEQRVSSNEARMKQVETDVKGLRTHIDKGLGMLALLVVVAPIFVKYILG